LLERLLQRGLLVIKTLFQCRAPFFRAASEYRASAFLIEDGRGRLPGGNAHAWKWQSASSLDHRRPILLAGGLNRSNVTAAVAAVQPDAVDISSGVEVGPGEKSPARVKRFVTTVQHAATPYPRRRIFK
jgi:phosphoribosylanthranilate isomerase